MSTRILTILALTTLLACDSKSDDTSVQPTDTDTDADSDTDSDTDADTDADVLLQGLAFEAEGDITSREQLEFTLVASYDDGSTQDVTASATVTSSDEDVLQIYQTGVGQPLDGGSGTLSATYESVDASLDFTVSLVQATAGDLVINELLADGTVDGDPNQDGSLDGVEDEFIELANASDVAVDLGGVTIVEQDFAYLPRHTFAEGTVLKAGQAVVVFGGGDVSALSGDNVSFVVAQNDDPGIAYGLSLSNEGETVKVIAADGTTEITSLSYGAGGAVDAVLDESVNLDPDIDGTTWVPHPDAAGAVGAYSPGTLVDGSAFPGPDARYSD